ncbi:MULTISPECIES: CHAD domain-containing protein [unclassified Streptomyces]|uniref:CHAD domain-containing protein n=1 Tax=unclassified Streptomyces TaxID=2593676 RepID=UPI0006F6EBB5|nr:MULTISPECIES: CHAD domain-containing protein [unclassified Streptomyces]KQX59588.1 metal-binding protein [Streptomyces sp. Root1304]KRB00846.1 metal-binding protein [Streptomyces sp. Root66D1]
MHNPDHAQDVSAGEVLAPYLHARAADFLRGLRLHGESGSDTAGAEEAARTLRGAARRISGTLHTFRPLLDTAWADQLRTELVWLSGTLAVEQACTSRLFRLVDALSRLSNGSGGPSPAVGTTPGRGAAKAAGAGGTQLNGAGAPQDPVPAARGSESAGLTVGAARAGALLERQLTLARTRAHSASLQALGSARFHALADAVALLASEVPLGPVGTAPAVEVLDGPAELAERRLLEAVAALPLTRAAHPYNAEALALAAGEHQDAPWHHTRLLLRLHRYATEALHTGGEPDSVLYEAARALDRHRDAAEAAAAAAAAARTPRIAPATAYALGVLHADQRHEVEAARFAFQRTWRRTTAPVP